MHERALVSTATNELLRLSAGRPLSHVGLTVGPDTDRGVVENAWRALTSGTPLAHADVSWTMAQHELACLECNADYAGGKLTTCPECGGNGLIVMSAPEVSVTGWALEEEY